MITQYRLYFLYIRFVERLYNHATTGEFRSTVICLKSHLITLLIYSKPKDRIAALLLQRDHSLNSITGFEPSRFRGQTFTLRHRRLYSNLNGLKSNLKVRHPVGYFGTPTIPHTWKTSPETLIVRNTKRVHHPPS